MRRIGALALFLLSAACAIAKQPDSARTVAAFEIPVATADDRQELLTMLSEVAQAESLHLDAATREELQASSVTYRQTISAAVWRGKDDDESIASVMDAPDHLPWIMFSKGKDEKLSRRFRDRAVSRVMARWPNTSSLPIMPTGAIPHPRQLIRTPRGYVVSAETLAEFQAEERKIQDTENGG